MNSLKTTLAYCLLFIFISFIISGCETSKDMGFNKPDRDPILRVGLKIGVPQLLSQNAEGDLSGLEIDLLNHFAKENGYLLETTIYNKDELFFALRRGEIDIAIPCGTDSLISSNFLNPCAQHFNTGQRVMVPESISMFIKDKKQCNNEDITVLTVAGSVSANFAKKLFPDSSLISLRDLASCAVRVEKEKGNILLTDSTQAWNIKTTGINIPRGKNNKKPKLIKLNPVLPPLTDEKIAWAVRRSDKELKNFLDSYMLKLENNGTLKDLIEKNSVDVINQ